MARRKAQVQFVRNAMVQFALQFYFKGAKRTKTMRRKNTFTNSTISSARKRAAAPPDPNRAKISGFRTQKGKEMSPLYVNTGSGSGSEHVP